jgi:hypothetical protein
MLHRDTKGPAMAGPVAGKSRSRSQGNLTTKRNICCSCSCLSSSFLSPSPLSLSCISPYFLSPSVTSPSSLSVLSLSPSLCLPLAPSVSISVSHSVSLPSICQLLSPSSLSPSSLPQYYMSSDSVSSLLDRPLLCLSVSLYSLITSSLHSFLPTSLSACVSPSLSPSLSSFSVFRYSLSLLSVSLLVSVSRIVSLESPSHSPQMHTSLGPCIYHLYVSLSFVSCLCVSISSHVQIPKRICQTLRNEVWLHQFSTPRRDVLNRTGGMVCG